MKVLTGHTSADTAYLVEDYPYGFRLRCQIRYWIETTKHGQRVVSQTTNPKRSGVRVSDDGKTLVNDDSVKVWNKPKASTYTALRVLYLDEQGHVQNAGLSVFATTAQIAAFEALYGEAVISVRDHDTLRGIKVVAAQMDDREARRKAAEATL